MSKKFRISLIVLLVLLSIFVSYLKAPITNASFVDICNEFGYLVEWWEVELPEGGPGQLGSRWVMDNSTDIGIFGCDTMVYPTSRESKDLFKIWCERYTTYSNISKVKHDTNFYNYEYFECVASSDLIIIARVDNFVIDLQVSLDREDEAREFVKRLGF